jgi:putative lipoic acid-binding regulatory protein
MQPDNDSLFEFPCDFPIKVMGKAHPEFAETIVTVVKAFDPDVDASRIETRPSSGGNYTGLTVTVRATSRAHLDDIYRALTGHPMVKVVL